MCNWCTNKITIRGDNLERLKKHFIRKDDREPRFDFNTIIPMPKELEVEKSSKSNDGFLLYLASINPLIPNIGKTEDKLSLKEFSNVMVKHFPDCFGKLENYILKPSEVEDYKARNLKNLEETIAMGKQVFDNLIKFGYSDWYDWSIDKWGTKWNACNTFLSDDMTEILFDSAWSPSLPVIAELAKMYPDLEITHEWAEEQTGWYSGKYTYRNGELVEALDYDSYSKEAYELSFELWGNDEAYRFNEETGNYEWIEEDE